MNDERPQEELDERLDRKLDEALASLPRPQAGRRFTSDVLRRLEREPGPGKAGLLRDWRARPWAAWVPAAMAATVLAAVGLWMTERAGPTPVAEEGPRAAQGPSSDPPEPRRQEIDDLRRDYRRLSQDLAELKALVEESEPVLYLGGDDGMGLLLPREGSPSPGGPAGSPAAAHLPQPVRIVPAARSQL